MKNIYITGMALLMATVLNAQDWEFAGNNSVNPALGDMLGTTDNTPIPFRTDDTERMRLWNSTNVNIYGIGNSNPPYLINQAGFLGLGLEQNFFSGPFAKGPYSLLHLNGDNVNQSPQEFGYRDWMRYGISYTHNQDFMYVGPRQVNSEDDYTRAVICWADNNGIGSGPDDFSFLFTDTDINEPSGSYAGDEIMRLTGTGNVGIGNFQPNGLDEPPSHRLEVDGDVRIRDVNAMPMPVGTRDCILVGDWSGFPYTTDDHEVRRINFSTDPDEYLGGDGNWHPVDLPCGPDDWNADANGIHTSTPTDCNTGNVGIGSTSFANDKQRVWQAGFDNNATTVTAIDATIVSPDLNTPTWRKAVVGNARLGRWVFGGDFTGINVNETGINTSTVAVGVRGRGDIAKQVFGVYGHGTNGDVNTIGVYGHASSNFGSVVAGYFAGQLLGTQPVLTISDESLKQDVGVIENALELIHQLQPKHYEYMVEENEAMAMASGLQYGFLAQEVEEVLPNVVKPFMAPFSLDSLGILSNDETTYKGITYSQIIPILTAGIQEQQTQIETLNSRVDEMEALLAEIGLGLDNGLDKSSNAIRSDYELYQNRPNPFSTSTEIIWRMAEEAQGRINVQNEQGQVIQTLKDGSMTKGLHSIEWRADGLPAGTYFYSLEVDGQLMVKRAIKLER